MARIRTKYIHNQVLRFRDSINPFEVVERQPSWRPMNFALDSAARRPSYPSQTLKSVRLVAAH